MKQKTAFLLLFFSSLVFTASIVSYRPTEGEAADWSKPTLSDAYSDFLTYMKDLSTDAATMFSGTPTNTPTGAMKWNRTTDLLQEWSGAAWVDQPVSVAGGGTGSSTQSGARTNLGLGTMATQNSSSVTITGGAISGITDLPVADGGTGSSTPSAARTALGAAASGANSDITALSGVTATGAIATLSAPGSLTISSSTHLDGGYIKLGKCVFWYSVFDVTFGGTGEIYFFATVPSTASSSNSGAFSGSYLRGTAYSNSLQVWLHDTGKVRIYDSGANWTPGFTYRVRLEGTYFIP